MVFRNERTWQNAVDAGKTDEFHAAYEAAVVQVQKDFGQKHPLVIGGKEVWTRETFGDTSPSNRKLVLGTFSKGNQIHAKQAVAAARKAFPAWSATPWEERARIIRRAADLVAAQKFYYAALMSFENGKNRYEAMADVDETADLMRWYAEEMERNHGYDFAMGQYVPGEKTRAVLKPYGVWAVVAPFNFPIAIAGGMSAGALITGNTTVFKPASDTPYMGWELGKIFRDAGIPAGVFNYVTGPGSTVGQELVDNPDVAGFVFTGSRDVGIGAYRTFSETFPKPIITELGGKNPTLVTETADLDKAAAGTMRAAFGYGGQKCSACSRVLVDKRVKKAFLEKLVAETRKIKIGDPTVPDTYLPLLELDGLDDALELANSGDYGLTAGIFSGKPEDVDRFFRECQTGVMYANRAAGSTTGAVVGVQPFGGWKMSGISGKAAGGYFYLPQFMHEQSQSVYTS